MKRNDRLNEVFRKFRQKRALRRFISLFSVFVLLLTINTLKMNADTLERIPSCGIAEHEHGAECFDEAGNLVCGLEAHAHTDACYQERPKGAVAAEAVDTEVCEADDQELDSDLTEDGATPEEGSAEDAGDAIQSGAVDAAVDELDGLTLDDAAEDGDAAEGDDTAEGGDITEGDDTAVDGEIAEDAVEEAPGTPTYSIRNREFVLASELAGAMGLDLARVQDVAAVENEDGTVSGIGVEALDGDWLIYAAREFDEAEVAFILDEGIEVAVLTDGVPLTAPESDRTEGSSDELDLTDSEEDTADDAEDIDDAQADDTQVAAGSEDGTVAEDNDVEIGDDAEDVAGDADENAPADEDAADENVPADEDAADANAPADEDAADANAPADEDAADANAPADEDAADANAPADEDAADENVSTDEDAADENVPADEDAADENVPADEDAADENAPADEDAAVTDADEEAGDEAVAAKADGEAEGDKIDEADEDGVVEGDKADEEKADEEESDEEKVDEEKSDEEKSDEEKSDEEKSGEEKADEEKADEEKADEEKADEDGEDAEGEDAEDAADAEDESTDGEADGDTDGESGAPGSDEAEGAEGAEGADGQAASPVADDHTLTVDLSEEQTYPLSLRGLMSIFQTAPVAEQPQVEAETDAEAEADVAEAEADAAQAEDEAAPAEPAEAEAEAAEPQADTEATEVGTVEDTVIGAVQEETLVGSEDIAEPEAGEAVEVSDIEAVVEEYVQSEAVEAAAAEVEVTMAAPEPVVAAPEPVIDPEAALALSIEYDETLLSVEETGEDWLITPVAAFERTELTVGGVYTIAFINCTVEAPVAMPAQTFEGATDYITVKVEAGEGAFPEGTTMQLADIEDENVLSDIGDAAVTEDFVEVKRVHAVDITFRDAEGNEIEPLIPISVVMSVREIEQDQQTVVVHVDDEGNAAVVEETEVPAADVQPEAPADEAQAEAPAGDAAQDDAPATAEAEGGELAPEAAEAVIEEASEERVAFMADAFSIYAMVVTQKIETKVITAEGETYNITVSYGPEAQIPMGATLSVSEIEGDAAQGYLERTEETLDKAQVVTRARFFDIKIMDGETEVQPAVPVTVQAVLANDAQDEAENADAVPCAVHFADDTVEQPDVVEAAETGETVVFRAASFSVWGVVYTVDFHWTVNGETFNYSIPGGDCASLRDLLGLLNMVADDPETEANELDDFMAAIESVTFSAPELVRVHKIEGDTTVGALRAALEVESEYSAALTDEQRAQIDARALAAGDWALFSLRPFSTLETLTIAMDNGDTFAIAVTDAQITTRVMASDGNTYKITLEFGPEAMIPLDAALRTTEILPGDEAYADYLSRAKEAVFAQEERIELKGLSEESDDDVPVETDIELDEAEQAAGADEEPQAEYARFFDIEIWSGEDKIEPNATVSVRIELADAPEEQKDELKVVHFETDGPVVMDAEIAAATDIRFTTGSFSTYGVIVTPNPTVLTSNVSDLIGKGFTIKHGDDYAFASSPISNPSRIGETDDESQASIWYIERVPETLTSDVYYWLYTFVDGEKKYVCMTYNRSESYSTYGLTTDTTLESDGGRWFVIDKNNNGTYTFKTWMQSDFAKEVNGQSAQWAYLNHWNNEGFTGFYLTYDSQNHVDGKDGKADALVLTEQYPVTENKHYFVILKQGDQYYLVLNDGRLDPLTIDENGKFEASVEPMMWYYEKDRDGDYYLQHQSYARTVALNRRAETWFYSYINPTEGNGFSDPDVVTPYHDDLYQEWKDEYLETHPGDNDGATIYANGKKAELETGLQNCDTANETKKASSKIELVNIDGKYYIKSAGSDDYIGVSGTGSSAGMVGQAPQSGAAEVIFGNLSDITSHLSNGADEMARNHLVEHIDIGIEAKAALHIPLAPKTYYTQNGSTIEVPELTLVRVNADVPISSQDIKNAKLTAFQYDSNRSKVEVQNAYYITGYSGNSPTSISAAQVRIEGQFKVAMADHDPERTSTTSGNNRISEYYNNTYVDPYEGNDDWRQWRLNNQVYYNVSLTKDVEFQLEYNGQKLYDALGNPVTTTVPVELSASFSYWDEHNECPALHEGFETKNAYWHTGHYVESGDGWSTQWDSVGWYNNGQLTGIIPRAAHMGSGMDFILGGNKDQTAVVITKFIEDQAHVPIALGADKDCEFEIWQKDIDPSSPTTMTDKVKERFLTQGEQGINLFADASTNPPYGSNGEYTILGDKKTITVGETGYATIYDFDVPNGMVGVRETVWPSEVTDKNGKTWQYVCTYIKTDYVERKHSDSKDKYHITKDYGANDVFKISVPEVLGLYERDDLNTDQESDHFDTYKDVSEFLEFYIHNVYEPKPINIEVEKDWRQGTQVVSSAPAGASVTAHLKRYKLVNKGNYNQSADKFVKARVNIYSEHYTPHEVWYTNVDDFNAGDNLTISFSYPYNVPNLRYRVNDGSYVNLPSKDEAWHQQNGERVPVTFTVHVPENGEVSIYIDDECSSVGGSVITVTSDHAGSNNAVNNPGSNDVEDGVPTPPAPADKPDMEYVVDDTWSGMDVPLNTTTWKGKSGDLDAYDENGNEYLYFIDHVDETNVNGSMCVILKASNGAYLTSTGDTPLKITNQVPATVTLLKKDSKTQEDLKGAKFELSRLELGQWKVIATIDMTNDVNAAIPQLFDGRYRLEETQSPASHKILDNKMYFRVRNGVASLTDESGSDYVPTQDNLIELNGTNLTVKNEPYETDIEILKIDETTRNDPNPTTLNHAKFKLSKVSNTGAWAVYPDEGHCEKEIVADGRLKFEKLLDGEYKIEETKMPDGYIRDVSNTIYFKMENGVVTRHEEPTITPGSNGQPYSLTWSEPIPTTTNLASVTYVKASGDDNATFTVGNTPGARLPSTGGPGTTGFYLAGGLLTLLALVLLITKRRAD